MCRSASIVSGTGEDTVQFVSISVIRTLEWYVCGCSQHRPLHYASLFFQSLVTLTVTLKVINYITRSVPQTMCRPCPIIDPQNHTSIHSQLPVNQRKCNWFQTHIKMQVPDDKNPNPKTIKSTPKQLCIEVIEFLLLSILYVVVNWKICIDIILNKSGKYKNKR